MDERYKLTEEEITETLGVLIDGEVKRYQIVADAAAEKAARMAREDAFRDVGLEYDIDGELTSWPTKEAWEHMTASLRSGQKEERG